MIFQLTFHHWPLGRASLANEMARPQSAFPDSIYRRWGVSINGGSPIAGWFHGKSHANRWWLGVPPWLLGNISNAGKTMPFASPITISRAAIFTIPSHGWFYGIVLPTFLLIGSISQFITWGPQLVGSGNGVGNESHHTNPTIEVKMG